jgi:hypothetical protein
MHKKQPGRREPKSPKRPKTRLWYICSTWEKGIYPLILVSAEPIDHHGYTMRIRTITARAAARKYIRDNLANQIAGADFETDNPFSPFGWRNLPPGAIDQRKEYRKKAIIRVIKQEK